MAGRGDDDDRPDVACREDMRARRRSQPAVEDHPRQRPLAVHTAGRQGRIVGEYRPCAHADRVNFRPDTMEMDVFLRGFCNPWGHAFDEFGQSFVTDGAGFQGVSFGVPGAMYFTYAGARRILAGEGSAGRLLCLEKQCGGHLEMPGSFPDTRSRLFALPRMLAAGTLHSRSPFESAEGLLSWKPR